MEHSPGNERVATSFSTIVIWVSESERKSGKKGVSEITGGRRRGREGGKESEMNEEAELERIDEGGRERGIK